MLLNVTRTYMKDTSRCEHHHSSQGLQITISDKDTMGNQPGDCRLHHHHTGVSVGCASVKHTHLQPRLRVSMQNKCHYFPHKSAVTHQYK